MREFVTNVILFAAFAVLFSTLHGCTSGPMNTPDTNVGQAGNGSNTQSAKNSVSSDYPPLASALAEGELENLDGTMTKLSDRKGKVLLVNIWGIWCMPCIAEMPHLIELQDKYRDQGFEVVGMNIGADDQGTPEELEEIKRFVEKKKLNYTVVRSPDKTTKAFYAITKQGVVPQNIIVNRDGHLRATFAGYSAGGMVQLKQMVEKVIAE